MEMDDLEKRDLFNRMSLNVITKLESFDGTYMNVRVYLYMYIYTYMYI
jgi:hypothetical protein